MLFIAIVIYVVICIFIYAGKSKVIRDEVLEGSLAIDNVYRAMALRDEIVVNLESPGYVNYYAREGERVAAGDLVYTVDESGRLNDYLEELGAAENTLSDEELSEFKNDIIGFAHSYDPASFNSVYEFKYTLRSTVLKLANNNMLQGISNMNGAEAGANIVNFCYSPITGIVSYWIDGYEQLDPNNIIEDMFDEKEYDRNQLDSGELMGAGSPVFKVSTDENWSVVIQVSPEKAAELLEEEYIKVRFLKNQYEAWGKVSVLKNADGKTYVQLSFTNSMVNFATERFIDIELLTNEDTGLKIPLSAIIQKEFFLVPEAFVSTEEKDGQNGVYRQSYAEDGTTSVQFVQMDFYNYDEDEGKYYLDNDIIRPGDILYKKDSQETFVVSERATLVGVYNINKGYADFKQVNILYENDEYAIVKSNTDYGLRVYDYIVLDAESVVDDQLINE